MLAYENFISLRDTSHGEWDNPTNKFSGWHALSLPDKGNVGLRFAVEKLQNLCPVFETSATNDEHKTIIVAPFGACKVDGRTASFNKQSQFAINQVRPEQDWDRFILTLVFPDDMKFFWATKGDVQANIGVFNPQHKGLDFILNIKAKEVLGEKTSSRLSWLRQLRTWNDPI